MFGASAFIERRVRRARFDQALIDDEHPTPGAPRRDARDVDANLESRIIEATRNLDATTDATTALDGDQRTRRRSWWRWRRR